jgi:tetratricopeptide (TPR) repeat protein
MTHLVTLFLTVGLAAPPTNGQSSAQASGQPNPQQTEPASQSSAVSPEPAFSFLSKDELLRRIALYESAARRAEASHLADADQLKIYTNLGNAYLDAAMYPKAEEAMRRTIALLRRGSQPALAEEINQLALVHLAMQDLKQAEKDQLDALRVREAVGDPIGIALTWNDLAALYIKERHFSQGLDYAQRAMNVLGDNPAVLPADRIAIHQTLALALCGVHQCLQAIPLLKASLEIARTSFGADSLSFGIGAFQLGYAYWQNGQMDQAVEWMQRGTVQMKIDWGLGHEVYINAVQQYAKLLRQRGQTESAQAAEREVRQAQAVVDARSFAAR